MAEINLPVHLPAKANNAQCGEKRETASPAQNFDAISGELKAAPPAVRPFVADYPNPARRALKRQLLAIAVLLVCCLISYSIVNRWFLSTVVVQGRSMAPTLEDGDRCLLNRLSYFYSAPKRGDLVVLRDRGEGDLAVKRIIALPGESVRITNGVIFVNGRRLPEPYLGDGMLTKAAGVADRACKLAAREYFVLGDNRAESEDSRCYGPIARTQIVGTLIK